MKRFLLGLLTGIFASAAVGLAIFHFHATHPAALREPLAHVRNGFELTVRAPYAVTVSLFGPKAERAWGGEHWDPQFVHPQPAQDIPGAVFRVQHGHHESTWIMTAFDLDSGHIQYVYFVNSAMVTLIDIHCTQQDASSTKVSVTYERTALAQEANDHVREMGTSDANSGKEWEDAINGYLSARK